MTAATTTFDQCLRNPYEYELPGFDYNVFDETGMQGWSLVAIEVYAARARAGLMLGWGVDPTPQCNAALLVAENLSEFSWSRTKRAGSWTNYAIDGAVFTRAQTGARLELTFFNEYSGALTISAESFTLITGYTSVFESAPPDFGTEPQQLVWDGMPSWNTAFRPRVGAEFP